MTHIYCGAEDCIAWENGYCTKKQISISEDWECEGYEHFRSTYKHYFYSAVSIDGTSYKGLELNGKKIEYNGYVFYTTGRITPLERYGVTEERTGYYVGEFRALKEQERWDKFVHRASELPDVTSYPLAIKINNKWVKKESEDTE